MRILIPLMMFVLFLGAGHPARGTEFIQTNTFILSREETLTTDLWLVANQITIEGTVENDVFLCASAESFFGPDEKAGVISLSGQFQNDVWAIGNTIRLTGTVQDHARLIAKTISVNGSIANSVLLFGTTIHLTESSELKADARLVGENLIAEGQVQGDMILVGKNTTLSGTFARNVYITAQDIVVLPGTEIMGDLKYHSRSDLVLDPNVVLHGNLIREAIRDRKSAFSASSALFQFFLFLGALLAGSVFLGLFPDFAKQAAVKVRRSIWACLLTGMIAFFIIPMIVFFAILSIVGIPAAVLLLSVVLIFIYLSKIIVAITVGVWILRRPVQRKFSTFFFPLLTGLLLIYAGVNTGLAGLAIWFLVTFAGMGGMFLVLFSRRFSVAMPLQESYNKT